MFVTHLECRPCPSFVELSAFTDYGLLEGVALYLDEAEKTARRIGIPYRGPAREAEELLICALNPLRFAFIGWDGRVAPCVNLLLPVKGTLQRWNEEGEHQVEPFLYGRLQDAPLSELLVSSEFRRFNAPFTKRLAIEKQFVSSLDLDAGANALRALNKADEQRTSGLSANPFPDACAACPKVQGW